LIALPGKSQRPLAQGGNSLGSAKVLPILVLAGLMSASGTRRIHEFQEFGCCRLCWKNTHPSNAHVRLHIERINTARAVLVGPRSSWTEKRINSFQSLGARRGGKDADARLGDPSENQMLLGLKLHLLVTDILLIRDLQHSRHANDQDGCPGFRRSRDWLTVWLVATDSRARLILDCTMLVDYWVGVVGLTFSQINSCGGLAVSSLSVLVRSPFAGGPMLFLKDVQTHSTVLDCLLEESY
jgi:hypothetical protein